MGKDTFEGLRCPHCGEVNSLDVRVESLVVECRDCQTEVLREEVEALADRWRRLFRWIDQAGK